MTKAQKVLGLKLRVVEAKIAKLTVERNGLKGKCKHPKEALNKRYGSSDGYDGSYYWTDFFCRLCGHCWTADGSAADGIEVDKHEFLKLPVFTAKELKK